MSDSTTPYPPAFDTFNSTDYNKNTQQQQGLDFFFNTGDVAAAHPDLFDTDLDDSLAGLEDYQLQLLTVDTNDAFSFLRSDTPTCGPPSTVTASSGSAYDSLSSYSESFYNYPQSGPPSNYSFPLDLEMDFRRINVDPYAASQSTGTPVEQPVDPNSFGTLPPTPPRSPATHHQTKVYEKGYEARSSFSDYGPPRPHHGVHYYEQIRFQGASLTPAVAPGQTTQLPMVPSIPLIQSGDEVKGHQDPRKKYKCPACPRAFARAYNLKTHMATHDPNRLKPHVCPHRSCGRSFSRKHDLGRHLISIHRDESLCSSHHSASSKKSIGVENGPRTWCDRCGKGGIGREAGCDCVDIK